jgi:hypothetical protein
MSLKKKLRSVLMYAMLGAAAIMGMPMRPEQIEELMSRLSRPKIVVVIPDDRPRGDGLKE